MKILTCAAYCAAGVINADAIEGQELRKYTAAMDDPRDKVQVGAEPAEILEELQDEEGNVDDIDDESTSSDFDDPAGRALIHGRENHAKRDLYETSADSRHCASDWLQILDGKG